MFSGLESSAMLLSIMKEVFVLAAVSCLAYSKSYSIISLDRSVLSNESLRVIQLRADSSKRTLILDVNIVQKVVKLNVGCTKNIAFRFLF